MDKFAVLQLEKKRKKEAEALARGEVLGEVRVGCVYMTCLCPSLLPRSLVSGLSLLPHPLLHTH